MLAVGALQVYKPMETLFIIAAFTTLAENFLPQLIAIPRVRPTSLCMSSEPRQLPLKRWSHRQWGSHGASSDTARARPLYTEFGQAVGRSSVLSAASC